MFEDIQSESYILKEEASQKEWERQYREFRNQAFTIANKCFLSKSIDDIKILEDFFANTDIVKELSESNDFAFLLVIMEIYELEKAANVGKHIFCWADSLGGVIEIIRQMKFLLWEMEFLGEDESGRLLLSYISDMNISMPAFEYLIHISSCDKRKIVEAINKLLI